MILNQLTSFLCSVSPFMLSVVDVSCTPFWPFSTAAAVPFSVVPFSVVPFSTAAVPFCCFCNSHNSGGDVVICKSTDTRGVAVSRVVRGGGGDEDSMRGKENEKEREKKPAVRCGCTILCTIFRYSLLMVYKR